MEENHEETGQNAAAGVGTGQINVVQNFIPLDWLANTLPGDPHKYASVVKQIFIMQAGVTVKMQRTMDAPQRNLNSLLQYGLGRNPRVLLSRSCHWQVPAVHHEDDEKRVRWSRHLPEIQ